MTDTDQRPHREGEGAGADRGRSKSEAIAPPTAQGFATPPSGRRVLWAVVVPTCPACGHLHLHRSTGRHGGRRTGSCGATYLVVLAGAKRGRWAA